MNVILVAIGSSGDILPMADLGLRLRGRGHVVTVLVNDHFAPVMRRMGIDHRALGTAEEFATLIARPEVWDSVGSLKPIAGEGMIRPMRPTFELIKTLNIPGDTIVVAPSIALGARVAQEVLGVPLVSVALQPSVFRSEAMPPRLRPLPLSASYPRVWNRAWYRLADAAFDRMICPELNAFRRELGLPKASRILNGWWFSPDLILGLFPEWFASKSPDWPSQTELVGFPSIDGSNDTALPPEVEAFLNAGEPPLVFTPGSANRHARAFFAASVDACVRLNRRAALITRFSDQIPQRLPDGVRHFNLVPFTRLFPRVAAVIHHGGIGTASLAIAAGVPQLIMPMAYDQPDNAARLVAFGIAKSISPRDFNSQNVAGAIKCLLDDEVKAQCRKLAALTQNRDTLERGVRLIEGLKLGETTGSF